MKKQFTAGILILGLVLWALDILLNTRSVLTVDVNAQGLDTASERISAPNSTPQSVLYQGYVAISNEAYDGDGYFKFAVTNNDGSTFYWSNDGTLAEPTMFVPIEVLGGYFTVLLGDTSLTGMTQALGPGVFQSSGRYLKVWFSTSVSGPFDPLDPVPIAAAPYALNSAMLDGNHVNEIASTAAYAGGDQSLNLDLPDRIVRFVTIHAPRSGRVMLNASGYGYLPVSTNYLRCSITTGSALDNSALSIVRGASYLPLGLTRGYTVGAGTHRFNLVCDSNSNQVVVRDTNVTAIFVPATVALHSSLEADTAAKPIPDGCVDEHESPCRP